MKCTSYLNDGKGSGQRGGYRHAESRPLNNPIACPNCGEGVRKFDGGKLVNAMRSSPYDGEFDANIHTEHVCDP